MISSLLGEWEGNWELMKQPINNSSFYTQKISHWFPEEMDTTRCLGK